MFAVMFRDPWASANECPMNEIRHTVFDIIPHINIIQNS